MKCFIGITLALSSLLATAQFAPAQDTICDYTTSSFTTIEGDLVVPNNATCQLLGSGSVSGNVAVGQNAGLVFEGGWTVGGSLEASGCAYVALNPYGSGSTLIGHALQIENCTGNSPALGSDFPAGTAFGSFGTTSLIGGNFLCLANAGPCLLRNQHVGGNVRIAKNKSSAPAQITSNVIAKNLYCDGNIPAPTGKSNWIAGNPNSSSQGQCNAL